MQGSIVKAFARAVTVVLGTAVLIAGHAASAAAQQPLRAEVAAFIEDMVRKHGFERAALQRVFSQVQWRPEIVRAMSAPATARPWHEFRSRYIDATRIAGGVKFWEENAAALLRAGREYGVPEEIIVATIGIETFYGRNTGTVKVIDALATLAFEFPARAELFRGELEEYLLLAREAGFDSLSVRGSYAGAMGIPQFLPSSYRKYALDFDGDGRRNLWGDPTDAIGSVANYYRTFGWLTGELVTVPVEAGESGIDVTIAAGIKPQLKVGELRRRGVVPLAPVSDEAEAALFAVETESGLRYRLGLQNFYVITRYNRSVNYAMAVYELAREIRALTKPASEAPRQ
ncbi:MAG: lytic murein transglycosylase B [Betaproteobacteria bacterium RIFCSPLOWO2_12_FULL_62_58]|nr:MAG: lytic murein transglycosylase B [Betaproteobacteria bacterium RIFCSPLOWO2_12_FULL_62_58]